MAVALVPKLSNQGGFMNKDIIKGNWNELKGKIKQQWSKLTDNDLDGIEGNIDEITGRIQKVYGYSKETAKSEYDAFKHRHNMNNSKN